MLPEGEINSSIVSEKTTTPSSRRTKVWISGETAVSSNMNDVRKRVLAFQSHKTKSSMVLHAVKVLGVDERGASLQSITKWIVANSEVLDIDRTKIQVKKAVLKALNSGVIERSETSKKALGASGSFVPSKGVKSNGSFSPAKLKTTNSATISKPKNKKKKLMEKKLDPTPHERENSPGSDEF